MDQSSSTITLENLDEASRYKVTFSALLYEGNEIRHYKYPVEKLSFKIC